jgi:hypothetical protein
VANGDEELENVLRPDVRPDSRPTGKAGGGALPAAAVTDPVIAYNGLSSDKVNILLKWAKDKRWKKRTKDVK